MEIDIATSYRTPIKVGTHADDRRIGTDNLYLEIPQSAPRRVVLTQAEALELMSVLAKTIRDLPATDDSG